MGRLGSILTWVIPGLARRSRKILESSTAKINHEMNELTKLDSRKQKDVLEYVNACVRIKRRKGVPGATMLEFSGWLNTDELKAIAQAIDENCEQIDE